MCPEGMHKLGQRAKEQWLQFDGKNTTLRLRITVMIMPLFYYWFCVLNAHGRCTKGTSSWVTGT